MNIAKDAFPEGIGHTCKRTVSRKHIDCTHASVYAKIQAFVEPWHHIVLYFQ